MCKQYLIVLFLVVLVGCNQQVRKQEYIKNSSKEQISENKTYVQKKINLEVVDQVIKIDTLQIVSSQKMLYYPFGIHKSIQNFSNKLPEKFKIEEDIQDNTVLYTFLYDKSKIKGFLSDDCFGKDGIVVNIIKTDISDTNIILFDNIKIGITKNYFAQVFDLNDVEELESIKVVEFISALAGIWHFYTFDENDTLKNIEIKTDYTFE